MIKIKLEAPIAPIEDIHDENDKPIYVYKNPTQTEWQTIFYYTNFVRMLVYKSDIYAVAVVDPTC